MYFLRKAETGIPAGEISILFEGKTLDDDKKTVSDCGIKNGDAVYLRRTRKNSPGGSAPAAGGGLQVTNHRKRKVVMG